jgi:hypothetical protein
MINADSDINNRFVVSWISVMSVTKGSYKHHDNEHYNKIAWIRNQLDVTFALSFISPLQVVQNVSGNHVPIFRSWRLRSVIATCWYCAVAAGRPSELVSRQCVHWGVRSTTVVQRTPQLLTGSDSLPAIKNHIADISWFVTEQHNEDTATCFL